MVSKSQLDFFDKLLEEKDFGEQDKVKLKEAFAQLNKKSASAWIEKAIGLPKIDESGEALEPAPF